jgi:K+-sensing histidine kinase KdpD
MNKIRKFGINENYVDEMLFDIVADNTSICEKFNLKLEIDCPINFLWYFDKKLISGVINNALINLIRYTNSKVIISAKIESDYLQIDICDDSKGFPSQVLNEFDTVKKGDSNFSEIKLGANWYYALKILEMHENQAKKGDYNLSNNRDFEGAKIRIIIP